MPFKNFKPGNCGSINRVLRVLIQLSQFNNENMCLRAEGDELVKFNINEKKLPRDIKPKKKLPRD